MEHLSVDFETRSTVDLTRTGVYPYAAHEDTSIICMAYAFGDGPVRVWRAGERWPREIDLWVTEGKPLRAHNAQFERIMWRECLIRMFGSVQTVPVIPRLEQWHCTAAEAAAMALPRHLKGLSRVLNVDEQKDPEGHDLMLRMCKPRSVDEDGTIHWWDEESPERLEKLIEYCKQDVRAERACAKKLRRLYEQERQVYLVDQRINDRGVKLDLPLIRSAQELVEEGTQAANAELAEVTDGEVTKVTQVARLTGWLQDQGLDIDNIQKATLRDVLEDSILEPDVERAIQLRQAAGKSSNAKLDAMLRCVCDDGYARGLLLYHGASTGRWSGKLIQPQNLPRPTVKDVEQYIPAVLDGSLLEEHEDPLEVVSSMLRSMMVSSDGCRFLSGDFSQIEARITGWYGGEPYGDMEYERMASSIFGVPLEEVTEEQRQVGKVAILGAGFQMGPDLYQDMVKEWTGLDISYTLAQRAIDTYRTDKSGVQSFWYEVEEMARRAVKAPGDVMYAGRPPAQVAFVVRGQFLWCVLPSGRPLAYALPKVEVKPTPWGDMKEAVTYCGVNGYTRKWERMSTYGGHLTENVVQGTARDVMAEAMLKLEDAGYPLVLSVHDELVADVPEGEGSLEEFLDIMEETPEWADGLEIEVEGWEGERYRK